MSSEGLRFEDLVAAIEQTHAAFAAQAGKAVNISLTLRNWFIGHRIAEYELDGADRASYGESVIERLADRLGQTGLKRLGARELRRFVQFYRAYPQIREALPPVLASLPAAGPFMLPNIRETPSPETGAVLPYVSHTSSSR